MSLSIKSEPAVWSKLVILFILPDLCLPRAGIGGNLSDSSSAGSFTFCMGLLLVEF